MKVKGTGTETELNWKFYLKKISSKALDVVLAIDLTRFTAATLSLLFIPKFSHPSTLPELFLF